MRSFIAATLISAVAAETYTAWKTEVDTVISCGPEVTNCPGSSTSAWAYKPTTSAEVKTTSTSTCTDEISTSVSKTWAESTSTPVTHTLTTESKSTETVHITSSYTVHSSSSAAVTTPTLPASWVKSSGVPYPSGSCSPGHPGYPGYTGSTGFISKTAAATGTGAWAYPSSTPMAAKGAASSLQAAGVLAGAGALFAFLV